MCSFSATCTDIVHTSTFATTPTKQVLKVAAVSDPGLRGMMPPSNPPKRPQRLLSASPSTTNSAVVDDSPHLGIQTGGLILRGGITGVLEKRGQDVPCLAIP